MELWISEPLFAWPLLIAVGFLSGVLNVLAGGGSFITLPVLIFLGLPAGVANGTNRVAIVVQNAAAAWSFRRYGVLVERTAAWAALPATAGSVVGTWLALAISDRAFERLLAFFMVGMSLWTLWTPRRRAATAAASNKDGDGAGTGGSEPSGAALRYPYGVLAAGSFVAGVYGGFVQAGVGFLLLAVTTAAGLDLVRGNAVKVVTILWLTVVSLAIFVWQGRVLWTVGLCLAAGTLLGGLVGARLTVRKGHRFVRFVVTVTVIVFALKLLLQ